MSHAPAGPTRVWWISVFARNLLDFRILAQRHGGYFINDAYAEGVISEIKRLRPQLYGLYAVTFVSALVVLAGGLPSTADIEAFGVKMPATLFSQQALSVITAGLYTYFIGIFASTIVATAMLRVLISVLGDEPWEFYAAKFDISNLWAGMVPAKTQGYASPLAERVVVWLVMLSAWAALSLHAGIVMLGSLAAWSRAARSHDALAMILAGFSLFAVAVTLLAFLISFLVPLPYRWNGPWPPPQPQMPQQPARPATTQGAAPATSPGLGPPAGAPAAGP